MPAYSSYRRAPPPLPDPASLPFPGNLIRQCSDCYLRQGCTAPVPGRGPAPAQVLLLGQNPGRQEDESGVPFYGQAGQQLDSLLFQCGINRETVYITNTVRCLTRNNAPPVSVSVHACAKWLNIELGLVQPQIIVAMGAFAIHAMLGEDAGTVEHLHGRPIEKDGRIILPSYHPAAGLHETSTLRFLFEDFQVLRGLLQGKTVADYTVRDEYPNPDYRVVSDKAKFFSMLATAEHVAVDVETVKQDTQLWSAQFATEPGTGWFYQEKDFRGRRIDLRSMRHVLVHHYLHDVRFIDIADDRFTDSMVAAYLLGLPQGLKELAARLCGIHMVSYSEVVRPGQHRLSTDYLTEAAKREWPDPPPIEETKWDNKQGCLVTRLKKPWHISRKIKGILDDARENSDVDMYERWRKIPDEERATVEKTLGVMPESSLADISFDDAVAYATRDSCATLRVYLKLIKLIHEAGLDFVLHMDTAILPMVHSMMATGMAADLDRFRSLSVDYDARMRLKSTELASVVGHPFNPSSSPQVATVIYNELGFKPTSMTATGLVSTDDEELKKTGHPVAKGVIEYRRLSKMKGTYADALVEWAIPDGDGVPRVHTTLKTTRVETGRLSCVPLTAEALTRQGWKTWDELVVGEELLGHDLDKESYAWTTLRAVHRGRGILGRLHTRGGADGDIFCTPEHKCVVVAHRSLVEAQYLSGFEIQSDKEQDVWCPETDTGTWLMRQGKTIVITGNSANPNLQNIPTRSKEGKAIKNGIVAPPGKVLLEADLAQIEMVTLAHLSGCKRLIEMFLRGGDPHTEMAAYIFGKSLEEAKQEKYRYPVKRLNFGVAYLIGPQGLAGQINEYIADLEMEGTPVEIEPWSVETCEKFLAEWYRLNPEVKDFQLEMVAMARRLGYVADIFGRRRFIPEVFCPIRSIQEAGGRQAANMPVTASAQGIAKIAMGRLWREWPGTPWIRHLKWIIQIHDSILVEVTEDEKVMQGVSAWMLEAMTNSVQLRVPIKADVKVGKRWGEMAKYRLEDR